MTAHLPTYDEITTADKLGDIACVPEVFPIGESLRVILLGKVCTTERCAGHSATLVPRVVVENLSGHDSLGVEKWDKVNVDRIEMTIIADFVLTIRQLRAQAPKPPAFVFDPRVLPGLGSAGAPPVHVGPCIVVPQTDALQPLPPGTVFCGPEKNDAR